MKLQPPCRRARNEPAGFRFPAWRRLVWIVAGLLGANLCAGQDRPAESERLKLQAEFSIAKNACDAAADSGSLSDGLARLAKIANQDAVYPGLKVLRDSCTDKLTEQAGLEDAAFSDGKNAYEHQSYAEARAKFEWLVKRNTKYANEANRYLSDLHNVPGGGSSAAGAPDANSKKDYADLQTARRMIASNDLMAAKRLLESMVGRPGSIAQDARKDLDRIDLRWQNIEKAQQAVLLIGHKRYDEALAILRDIQNEDPEYTEITSLIRLAGSLSGIASPTLSKPDPAAAAEVAQGQKLLADGKYEEARSFLAKAAENHPKSQEIRQMLENCDYQLDLIKIKERTKQQIVDAEAALKKKDFVRARVILERAKENDPKDAHIDELLERAGQQLGEPGTQTADQIIMLDDGIRAFYRGDYPQSSGLLGQYVEEKGKNSAVAYFYLGASACADYFLTGAKEEDKKTKAREFFARSHRASAAFSPPKDWVSPKIIAMYKEAVLPDRGKRP